MRSRSSRREPTLAAVALLAASACGGAAATGDAARPVSQEEFVRATHELTWLRNTEPRSPYAARVRLRFRAPDGRELDGRGAVAVAPHRAMRMILVGPGGQTAFDAWVTKDAWRLAIPALDRVERGAADASPHLPIGFFRWWFLAPLEGDVLSASPRDDAGARFVLKDDGAVVQLDDARDASLVHLVATRRRGEDAEHLDWRGRSLTPAPGDHATYVQPKTGVRVDVIVEGVSADAPEPDAFADPDAVAGDAPEKGDTPL